MTASLEEWTTRVKASSRYSEEYFAMIEEDLRASLTDARPYALRDAFISALEDAFMEGYEQAIEDSEP